MLSDKIDHYKETGQLLNNTPAQYKNEFEWLKDVDAYALCNEQLNLKKAFNRFSRNKNIGFPKFKSKKHDRDSYTTNNVHNLITIENNRIKLSKLGWCRFANSRQIPTNYSIKCVTISQSSSEKYYISILTEFECEVLQVVLDKTKSIGLDYSSHDFYVDSNGISANYPRFFRKYEIRLAFEQRKLSHMKLHSNNYEKQKIKVAKIQERISNCRKNWLHKLSTELSNKYDYICIEDIDMQSIAQALRLGKSTNDNGFGMFRQMLEYKLSIRGKKLIKINRWTPTSTVCSNCGAYHKDVVNSLKIRKWTCPDCGASLDRDTNAATNIRKIGLSLL